jgi:hypothetical protein
VGNDCTRISALSDSSTMGRATLGGLGPKGKHVGTWKLRIDMADDLFLCVGCHGGDIGSILDEGDPGKDAVGGSNNEFLLIERGELGPDDNATSDRCSEKGDQRLERTELRREWGTDVCLPSPLGGVLGSEVADGTRALDASARRFFLGFFASCLAVGT